MATTTTNYGFDVPTSSDLVKNGATAISTLGQDIDTFLFRPFSKNVSINGGFDFWQRGTSFTATGYTADRWYASISGTTTVAQETSIVPDGSTYALKWTTGASSSYAEIYNAFEAQDVNALGGKTVTVSVQVRAQASFASTFRLRLQTNTTANTQTGGAWTTVVTTDATPSTSAFGLVSATYTVPVGTKGLRIALQPAAAQASGTGLYLGQVQLEVGSQASPFTRAGGTIQGELAACQRYYWRSITSQIYGILGFGMNTNTTVQRSFIRFPVTMRTSPSALESGGLLRITDNATYTGLITAAVITANESSLNGAECVFTVGAGGLTINQPSFIGGNNDATAYIGFSAEL